MTGPEHYREAERLLTEAHDIGKRGYGPQHTISLAHVHALLAQTAATAMAAQLQSVYGRAPVAGLPVDDARVWEAVAGES